MEGVYVIIPAFNEENSIGLVLADLPSFVAEVIVVDNNSTDSTHSVAKENGATVLLEKQKGYGAACLKGIHYLNKNRSEECKVVAFIDADYSDHPNELGLLLEEIENGKDIVIGNRVKSKREEGAMMPQQLFGNWLATFLIQIIYGVRHADLGPFRAIRYKKLLELNMVDKTFGWTVEMQVKAIKQKLNYAGVSVSYRKRVGVSKISGTIYGTVMAGYKIISTLIKLR
ncbi:MAG: glycosyltransferase family 2 protein [Flavobacteriales bacterium]|nr:glycosyltransferase family 2 protein [Flavobacteriales bacterium]